MNEDIMNRLPTVSVIVPVYNDENNIPKLMESLLNQDYPQELYEIIVIDNNSTDHTRKILSNYPIISLSETDIQSSYAARNKGIAKAKNKILAFIDSDCIASTSWLKEGVLALECRQADLVGGKVEFYFSPEKTASECYDSLIHFRFEESIQTRSVTGAGNLFVKREVFEKIGLFPTVKSGGDFQWTGKAVREGFQLIYCSTAIVKHPARKLKFLLQKHFRTGSGKPFIWKTMEGRVFKPTILLSSLPPNILELKKVIQKNGTTDMQGKIFSIWFTKYLCRLFFFLGAWRSILFIVTHPRQIKTLTMSQSNQTDKKDVKPEDISNFLPTVSVIVPVYNAEDTIPKLVEALLRQNYPQDFYEIIFVDNNSKDSTPKLIEQCPVIFLQETMIQSSYAARNLGVRESSGEILAFTDSDCIPDPSWIMEGVLTLQKEKADLAGGPVEFIFSKHKTAAEIFDSLINLDYTYWKTHNVWATANLFVKRKVFDSVGEFPLVKSGGDLQWTGKAVKEGFPLTFASGAVVHHPARGLNELLRKSLRIGKGAPAIWRSQEKTLGYALSKTLISFLPPKFSTLLKKIHDRGTPDMKNKVMAVWFVGYLSKITKGFGYISGFKEFMSHKHRNLSLNTVIK
jgi:glycosyltransferase involved in cell wall biosynthesis